MTGFILLTNACLCQGSCVDVCVVEVRPCDSKAPFSGPPPPPPHTRWRSCLTQQHQKQTEALGPSRDVG